MPANPTSDVANPAPTLLVRLDVGHLNGPSPIGLTADYLSDGTVIRWTDAGTGCRTAERCPLEVVGHLGEAVGDLQSRGALERNTLTAAGLAAVRALLAQDADLLGLPRVFEPQLLPGKQPSGRPRITASFVMEGSEGNRYTVNAPSPESFDAPSWAPNPAIERLSALAATLADPAAVVGPSGFIDSTWTPYTPGKTAVFVRFLEIEPAPSPTPHSDSTLPLIGNIREYFPYADISDFGWPFAGTPETFGSPFTPAPSADFWHLGTAYRCAFLPTADAVTGIGRLPGSIGAARDLTAGVDWTGGFLRWSGRSPTTGLSLAATVILPEDAGRSCADLQPLLR